ncbi:MAG: hypothetical protein IPL92_08255 [Saprospiraceae bacterium]|nr:hypothetical protein [Candidatus Opimibacter iunctus]
MKYTYVILLIFLNVWTRVTLAQTPGLTVEFYSAEHGLPHKYVHDITQDDQGYMWIATHNGLARYDGYTFTDFTYRITGDAQLKGLSIYCVEKDKSGNIWIGYKGGLAVMNPETGTVVHKDLGLPEDTQELVYQLFFDDMDRVVLVLGKGIVLCYDANWILQFTYQFSIRAPDYETNLPLVTQDSDHSFWLSTYYNGIDHIDPHGKFIEHFRPPEDRHTPATLYKITTADHIGYQFPLGKRHADIMQHKNAALHPFVKLISSSYRCPSSVFDLNGNSWEIGLDSITMHDPVTSRTITFSLPYTREYQLDVPTQSIFLSRDNTLWATNRKGLFKINYKRSIFTNYLHRDQQLPSDQGISMRGLAEDAEGIIWAGAYPFYPEGPNQPCNLIRINPRTNETKPFYLTNEDGTAFIPGAAPQYKMIIKGQELWATSGTNYISRIDMQTRKLVKYSMSDPDLGITTGMYYVNDSTIFFSTPKAIARLNPERSDSAQTTFILKSGSKENFEGVNNFFDAGDDLIWVAANTGLFLIDHAGRIIKTYSDTRNSKIMLPALDINYVYPEEADKTWLGTRHGLILLDTLHQHCRLFTTKDGLPNNNIVGILPDEFGYLWLSTDNGLCRFHPAENSFMSYYVQDELPHNEFNRMASLKASDGRLYFGGLNGLTAFHPGDVDTSLNHLQPILISYSMFRGEKDSIYTYDGSLVNQNPVVFTHKDQLFNFRFMLPAYREPEKNRFLYKLQGWDKEWQNSGQSNVISFSYLPPGNYTLLVKGAASGDTWSHHEYRLQIMVLQAWYKTWWSITLAALALGGIFYAMYRYRLNQVLHVQQIRNKISADLHDELGSVLTQIALQSDMVSRNIYSEEEKQHELQNIRNTSREAILAMSDIVWSVSAGHDKTSNLIDRMKDHADLMLQPLDIIPDFKVTGLREERVMDQQLRQELFLIFKEAIHNIVKHSNPTYVEIEMSNEKGMFELKVKNDINTPRERRVIGGHGLKNMKRRAASIDGSLEIESGENSYTVILRRKEV